MNYPQRLAVLGPLFIVLALAWVLAPPAVTAAAPPDDSTVVLSHGKTRITLGDIRRSVETNIPPEQWRRFYAERKAISQHAGNVFVVRKLAEEAEARQLTPEESARVEAARVRALNQVQIDYILAQEKQPDYEAAAREQWQAHPESYQAPETVRASHVLIAAGDKRDDAAALTRAREVLAKARGGADFAALAKEYSDDASVAKNGGDLGFFTRGQMVKPFEDAAFALQAKGELTEPVKTQFGYHILRFEERRAAGVVPFEKVKDGLVTTYKSEFRTRIVNREIERIGALDGVKTDYEALMSLYQSADFNQSKDKAK